MSTELKNCPFCGSSSLDATGRSHDDSREYYYVFCEKCEATGPTSHERSEAVSKWNLRKEHEED